MLLWSSFFRFNYDFFLNTSIGIGRERKCRLRCLINVYKRLSIQRSCELRYNGTLIWHLRLFIKWCSTNISSIASSCKKKGITILLLSYTMILFISCNFVRHFIKRKLKSWIILSDERGILCKSSPAQKIQLPGTKINRKF